MATGASSSRSMDILPVNMSVAVFVGGDDVDGEGAPGLGWICCRESRCSRGLEKCLPRCLISAGKSLIATATVGAGGDSTLGDALAPKGSLVTLH